MKNKIANAILPIIELTLQHLESKPEAAAREFDVLSQDLNTLFNGLIRQDIRLIRSLDVNHTWDGLTSAVVYWVDEVFLEDKAVWYDIWIKNPLEVQDHLSPYCRPPNRPENEGRIRGLLFWTNAHAAIPRSRQVLEVYWLLVHLGFCGVVIHDHQGREIGQFDGWLRCAKAALNYHWIKELPIYSEPPEYQKPMSLPAIPDPLVPFLSSKHPHEPTGIDWIAHITWISWIVGAIVFAVFYRAYLTK